MNVDAGEICTNLGVLMKLYIDTQFRPKKKKKLVIVVIFVPQYG